LLRLLDTGMASAIPLEGFVNLSSSNRAIPKKRPPNTVQSVRKAGAKPEKVKPVDDEQPSAVYGIKKWTA
jgi:hypothetical protein